jgi:hypothetical protein
MLKVSLHFATPATISPTNVLGRLDIGYARLAAQADYKAVMVTSGLGEHPPVQIYEYPRWSASVWDLVARAVCKCLNDREVIRQADLLPTRRCAFIDDMTAVIEHWPDGLETARSTIATAHIKMCRRRGNYIATFSTDVQGDDQISSIFLYQPMKLGPWDLLARAYAWTVNECFDLPPKPRLYVPIPFMDGKNSLVSLDTVSEPAYSGIIKWLHSKEVQIFTSDLVDGRCIKEADFVKFLSTAV